MRSFNKKTTSSVGEKETRPSVKSYSRTLRIAVGAILGAIAVILQSAGIFTGIGYIFSMMSTGPIALAGRLSLRIGLMTYFLTICLLTVLQPSEVLVFSFTTGLLGLSLGFGLKVLKRSRYIILLSALCLTSGISILLYGFKFPVLGPAVTFQFNGRVILGVFFFSLLYSWVWKILSLYFFKILNHFLSGRLT